MTSYNGMLYVGMLYVGMLYVGINADGDADMLPSLLREALDELLEAAQ